MDYIKWIRSKVGKDKIMLNFVGGCIFNDEGKVLLQKRQDRNVWGFPGGALELGESVEEALKREVLEETGLEVTLNKLLGIYSKYEDYYPNGDEAQTITFFFELSIKGGKLSCSNEETLELKYFSLNAVPRLVNKQQNDFLNDLKMSSDNMPIIR